jgi:hypothetical protein
MKTPDPAHVAADLRERAGKGDLTLGKAELKRIAAMLEKLASRCGDAYQVVGSLAADAGLGDDPAVMNALDLLCDPLRRGNILPFSTPKDRERVRLNARLRANAKSSSGTVVATENPDRDETA